MDRRNFSKLSLTAAAGITTFPGLANSFKMENTNIRLGDRFSKNTVIPKIGFLHLKN